MPLWLLLIPLAIFLLIFLVFSIINLVNVWRYRSGFFSASFLIIAYFAGTAVIIGTAYTILSPVDWMQTIGLGITLPTQFTL